ncbi:MAG: septation protein SepH, partial [Leifsonia sp.]
MQDLRVIGVENGALLVSSDDGERFRIAIDDVLQSRIRQASPEQGVGRKLSPREIQDQIRSGMSAQDVASVTGMPVDHIEKYEGPILAEREHIVLSALDVPVHTAL